MGEPEADATRQPSAGEPSVGSGAAAVPAGSGADASPSAEGSGAGALIPGALSADASGADASGANASGSDVSDRTSDDSATDSNGREGSALKRAAGILIRVVSWTVLVTCGLLILAFVLAPRVTGSTPYTVLTGSMRPSMPPGTTVVVKPIDFDEIVVGDVITYQISSGEPAVVTHRVIGVDITADGTRLRTQGDANPAADVALVREEQVRGKAWYWLPVIGYVTNGVTSDTRTWLAQGLGVALIGYAVVTVVVAIVRRTKDGREGVSTGEAPRDHIGEEFGGEPGELSVRHPMGSIGGAPVEEPTRRSLRQAHRSAKSNDSGGQSD